MLRFEEKELISQLTLLPNRLQTAFAAACAERQFPNYVRFSGLTATGNPERLAIILAGLWSSVLDDSRRDGELETFLESCASLLPDQRHEQLEEYAYAEDAVASVIYAIETRLAGGCEKAMWAARLAYSSIDDYVANRLQVTILDRKAEDSIIAHPLIQTEFVRQRDDMAQLLSIATKPADERQALANLRLCAQRDAKPLLHGGTPL
jgi:uncharacterized protein YjaG (DUF416 family)